MELAKMTFESSFSLITGRNSDFREFSCTNENLSVQAFTIYSLSEHVIDYWMYRPS